MTHLNKTIEKLVSKNIPFKVIHVGCICMVVIQNKNKDNNCFSHAGFKFRNGVFIETCLLKLVGGLL